MLPTVRRPNRYSSTAPARSPPASARSLLRIPRPDCSKPEIAATIGTPPASAFCIISKEVRPLRSRVSGQRRRLFEQRPAEQLVQGVVPPDVFPEGEQFAGEIEKSAGVESAGAPEGLLPPGQPARQREHEFRRDFQPILDGLVAAQHGVDRGLAANPQLAEVITWRLNFDRSSYADWPGPHLRHCPCR